MLTKTILLDSIKKVKDFITLITPFEGQIDIVSGRYVINAKSIMGIFSVDISSPLELNIHVENPEDFDIDLSEFEYVEPDEDDGEETDPGNNDDE